MVITASASFTASSVDPARTQPPSAACASACSLRSNARTSCPALTKFGAIPPPMCPRPMNPMRAMATPRTPAKAAVQSRTKERRGAPPGLRPSPGYSLFPLPLARPLFDDRGHALLLALRPEEAVEQPALEAVACADLSLK